MKFLMIVLSALLFASISFSQEDTTDVKPVLVKRVEAVYPEAARTAGMEGIVYVNITIAKDGYVFTAMVKDVDDDIDALNTAAINAVLKWEFKPLPKETKVTVPFVFKLKKD